MPLRTRGGFGIKKYTEDLIEEIHALLCNNKENIIKVVLPVNSCLYEDVKVNIEFQLFVLKYDSQMIVDQKGEANITT